MEEKQTIQLIRTNSKNPDFIALVQRLDRLLAILDGDDHAFYDQFNKIDALKFVIVAYENKIPVGCGALKAFDTQTMELKRMYTADEHRKKGIASKVLYALEDWGKELSFQRCILETGINQTEAIQFYQKMDYRPMDNFGQYAGVENSKCFEKELILVN